MKILLNGIKQTDGQYFSAWYSVGGYRNLPEDTITVYAAEYRSFGEEIRDTFTVENDSDSMVDHFEKDHFRVTSTHPLYPEFAKTIARIQLLNAQKREKQQAKKAQAIANCETIVFNGIRYKIIKKTPEIKGGFEGIKYEMVKLFRPRKTYFVWKSNDQKRKTRVWSAF